MNFIKICVENKSLLRKSLGSGVLYVMQVEPKGSHTRAAHGDDTREPLYPVLGENYVPSTRLYLPLCQLSVGGEWEGRASCLDTLPHCCCMPTDIPGQGALETRPQQRRINMYPVCLWKPVSDELL